MKRIKDFFTNIYELALMSLLGVGALAVFGVQTVANTLAKVNWFKVFLAISIAAFVGSNYLYPTLPSPATIDPAAKVREFGPSIFVLTPTDNIETGGTGFQVRAPSGAVYIITNHHVCAASTNGKMLAALPEKTLRRRILVTILDMSEETDLCLLTPVPGRKALEVADSFPETDSNVFAVGHPLLLPNTFTQGVTQGFEEIQVIDHYMTKDGPDSKCEGKRFHIERMFSLFTGIQEVCVATTSSIQSTLIVRPGNSGSPVFSLDDKVVGVVFASSNATNYGFYIPLEVLKEYLSVY